MELTEDEIVQKNGKQGNHWLRNTRQPYEYDFSCIACGNNVINRKNELSKHSRNKKELDY